ncbi:MAG: histidine phosphatase family protein [Candidatus Omnitrophica bacterium]|nr:histidine phosphatase family protein [Candidatus Omnitrophota bacterium]
MKPDPGTKSTRTGFLFLGMFRQITFGGKLSKVFGLEGEIMTTKFVHLRPQSINRGKCGSCRLILIRHGITEWNKQGRYCGYKDVGLSSQGKAQAVKLRKSLKNISFDRIYCSDRRRALQTKAIVFGRATFIKVSDLREIHFGVLEGLKHDEVMKKYAQIYKKWLKDPFKIRIPEAESMQAFKKRVLRAMKKITHLNQGKTIVVVCHGGVIGIFVSSILKSRNFWSYVPSPASVTIVEYKKGKFRIKKFNQSRVADV